VIELFLFIKKDIFDLIKFSTKEWINISSRNEVNFF